MRGHLLRQEVSRLDSLHLVGSSALWTFYRLMARLRLSVFVKVKNQSMLYGCLTIRYLSFAPKMLM